MTFKLIDRLNIGLPVISILNFVAVLFVIYQTRQGFLFIVLHEFGTPCHVQPGLDNLGTGLDALTRRRR